MKTIHLLILPLLFLNPILLCSQTQLVPVNVNCNNGQGSALEGEQIWFKELNTNEIFKGISDENGKIHLEIEGPGIYMIMIKSIGDAQDYTKFSIPELGPNQRYGTYNINVEISPPKVFTLDNVYFEYASAKLNTVSFPELDELVELMRHKKEMVIEVGGHTDNRGSDEANLTLSQKRAESVRNYLVQKGIQSERIKPKGYGESRPVCLDETDSCRAKNRRTEVKILEE